MTEWAKHLVEWTENGTAYLSVVFTWDLPRAHMRAVWLRQQGYEVKAGGPACLLMPDYLAEVADVNGCAADALWRHNPEATFTSRGCIRRCAFCAVPKIEGDLVELNEWEPKPIVCDNNLLACSWPHFVSVADRLSGMQNVDLQGVDARLVTPSHALLLSRLDLSVLRVAWDHVNSEPWAGIEHLLRAGIPKSKIRVYVLLGFNDTPDDAEHRLRMIRERGFLPCPQRYNPLDAMERDAYVGEGWTDSELRRFMRYWYNPQVWGVPFEEWRG